MIGDETITLETFGLAVVSLFIGIAIAAGVSVVVDRRWQPATRLGALAKSGVDVSIGLAPAVVVGLTVLFGILFRPA